MIETSKCKWCIAGNIPELSPYAKVYIHRLPRLDRRCESQFSWNHKNVETQRDAIARELEGDRK
jgi:hypothetical protein